MARRTTTTPWYRRNGQPNAGPGVLHTAVPNIPALVDGTGQNTGGTQFYTLLAGAGLAVVGDNVYVTGNDAAGATANNGRLYGFNKLTLQSLTAANTPIHQYGGVTAATAACPNALLGVRVNLSGADFDYLFAVNQKTVDLGTIVNGVYTSVYSTTFVPEFRATSTFQGGVQAVCLNQSLAGVDPTLPPWFAFVDSNAAAALWTVSPSGVVTLAFSPSASHLFQAICVDDDGFVWAVENGGGSTLLHKLSVNYTTGVFTNVATVALAPGGAGLTSYNVTSDGRYICVLSNVSPTGDRIDIVDRLSVTQVRSITIPGTPSAPINMGYPTRMAFDGTALWVAIGVAGTSDGNLHVYYVQTESGEVLMDLGPFNPGGNNQSNRSIVVADDGTVITSTISGASSLALVYTSTEVPTVHARNMLVDGDVYLDGAGVAAVLSNHVEATPAWSAAGTTISTTPLSLTLVGPNKKVRVFGTGEFSASAPSQLQLQILVDGVFLGGSPAPTIDVATAGARQQLTVSWDFTLLAGGTHTFAIKGLGNGVATLTGDQALVMVQELLN